MKSFFTRFSCSQSGISEFLRTVANAGRYVQPHAAVRIFLDRHENLHIAATEGRAIIQAHGHLPGWRYAGDRGCDFLF